MYTKPQKNKGKSDEERNEESVQASDDASEPTASKERRIPTEEELQEMYAQPMKKKDEDSKKKINEAEEPNKGEKSQNGIVEKVASKLTEAELKEMYAQQ